MQICVRNITKRYKRKIGEKGIFNNVKTLFHSNYEYVNAVQGVSFEINQGEVVGYIGSNGSGKSTTIKMLSGILTPDSGEVTIDGQTVNIKNREFKQKIGVVFGQRSNLWSSLPAADTFQLFKYIYNLDDEEFENNFNFIDEYLDVSSIQNAAVRKLSLGQRMKCEICASMLHFPDILFLDEPTIGLDVNIRKSVVALLKEYNRRFHKTIIITSHNLYDIDELCSRVIIIDKGKILVQNTLEAVKQLYQKYKFVEIEYKTETARDEGDAYIRNNCSMKAEAEPQANKQIYKVRIGAEEVMNKLMAFIMQNEEVESFQVYQESLESIVGNIIG